MPEGVTAIIWRSFSITDKPFPTHCWASVRFAATGISSAGKVMTVFDQEGKNGFVRTISTCYAPMTRLLFAIPTMWRPGIILEQ